MKGFFVAAMVMVTSLAFASEGFSHEGSLDKVCRQRQVTFRVIRPIDVMRGTVGYCKDTTGKVVRGANTMIKGTIKGAGEILSAPFKAKMRLPQPKFYRWHRGHWYEVPTKPIKPNINLGVPVDPSELDADTLQFLPHPIPMEVKDILAYEYRF